jgi:DNA-directed RNA polymerase specialized sigma24 family protein
MRPFYSGVDHYANIKRNFTAGTPADEARLAEAHKRDRGGWFDYPPYVEESIDSENLEDVLLGADSTDPEHVTFLIQVVEHSSRLVLRLPYRQGQAVILSAQGATADEIADELGCTTKAAERLVERGRESLRCWISKEQYADLQAELNS